MGRTAKVERKTKETDIKVSLDVDGAGQAAIETGMPFFDHMLDAFSRHGFFNIQIQAKGDLEVDYHHTVEDVGLALGQAFKDALGDKQGIRRFVPHEFFAGFANQLGMNLHIDVPRGENPHHIIEACFKAFARAMDFATQVDPRVQGVLSTKGSL